MQFSKPESRKRLAASKRLRVGTFNTALVRSKPGALAAALAQHTDQADPQARAVAAIIQRVRPDVLLLNEFDYDPAQRALALFKTRYLGVSQRGAKPIRYRYAKAFASNTGQLSPVDLDGDGIRQLPYDALGYGTFPGQYAFALLSRYPLDHARLRSFRRLLWQTMPGNRIPDGYYSPQALAILPLSSKNHIDIALRLPDGRAIHLLACHPTPPVFDGPERRNQRRNHDEIRLLIDYISPAENHDYLIDDAGRAGGLTADADFIILGDLNADPRFGASASGAIQTLLRHPRLNPAAALGDRVPTSSGGRRLARPSATADFDGGLRVDYVLPSLALNVTDSGVFWPAPGEPDAALASTQRSADHRLVWVDIDLASGHAQHV